MIFSFSFIQNPILELHKPTYFCNFHYNRTIDWRSVKSWNWNGKIEIKRLPEVMWIETWGSLLLFLLWIWIEPLFSFCSWFFLGKTKNDEGERKNSGRKCCGVLLYKTSYQTLTVRSCSNWCPIVCSWTPRFLPWYWIGTIFMHIVVSNLSTYIYIYI